MGIYLNPGNEGFRVKRNGKYVDKSEMIAVMNDTLEMPEKLSCVSRPRRFGKSTAAQMLCAYYCKGCDSSELFDDLKISSHPDYRKHLNKYDVFYVDITGIKSDNKGYADVESYLYSFIRDEAAQQYPNAKPGKNISETIKNISAAEGNKFIAIIDEWDAPLRDSRTPASEKRDYLEFLRSLFKNSQLTDQVFAAAYMTGILPIKKDGSQSAVSEFREYSMLKPGPFASYIGFTEEEVKGLCDKYGADYELMKRWYDGYELEEAGSIYNSNSVSEALRTGKYISYWQASSSASSLLSYINLDFDGLGEQARELLGGRRINFETARFENDMTELHSRDDVLTLLVHFGYLSYDPESHSACIPNNEIYLEYAGLVREITHADTIRRVQESDRLLKDTVEMNADAVAAAIERVHNEEYTPLHYNNEQSLRSVIKLAYFTYKDNYTQFEELPGGKGYADIVYLPKKYSNMPILLIELKWDENADTAISQIKRGEYPAQLEKREEILLLVGISYNKEKGADKTHHCVIEAIEPDELDE